ncbi:DUF6499 domain-containing protein [Acuticoccus sp. MNP-M23]|uniref:transcriptional regulator domain-containing protein n=1 Tax=Acuticoccus sp. MNP-M23 TaxID=3072793 RepID=UPI002816730A|nr:DUF6499 domain-containing protein [Acuticoccus sp. MNP-M23]WMS43162.1 DUF6499 domain-containing protein [Acuticoccus sp. MNP-M23]
MVADTNWRDPTHYRYLSGLNRSELAWEFLRRNPEYEKEVSASDPADDYAATALTAHWGLRFPDSTELVRAQPRHFLDTTHRSCRSHSHASDFAHHDDSNVHGRSRVRQDSR